MQINLILLRYFPSLDTIQLYLLFLDVFEIEMQHLYADGLLVSLSSEKQEGLSY